MHNFSRIAALFANGLRPGASFGFDFSFNNLDRTDLFRDVVQFRWNGAVQSFYWTREFGTLTLAP